MPEARLSTVGAIVGCEWRTVRRSPVFLIGLLAAGGFLLSESRSPAGWPPATTSLDAFQLTTSVLVGILAFLLAAESLVRDLDPNRSQLVFSRSIPIGVYLFGKLVAAISVGLALIGALLVIGVCRPWFYGVRTAYPLEPFLKVAVLCGIPMVVYSCSLAMFLIALSGRIIIALPAFLLYFFCTALLRVGGGGDVDFLDFSMRLYGRVLRLEIPIQLADVSFSHLLDPVRPELVLRGLIYLALSVLFAAGAGWLIARQRDAHWRLRARSPRQKQNVETEDRDDGTRTFQSQ